MRPASIACVLAMRCLAAQAQDAHEHHPHPSKPAVAAATVAAPDEYSSAHVPPAAPTHLMPPMSPQAMNAIMRMDDAARYGKFTINAAEWTADDALAWDVDAWYGSDRDKLRVRSDGEQRTAHESFGVDVLWDRIVARWWSLQGGIRLDEIDNVSRYALVAGLQGLAPQWFEVETSLYIRDNGAITWHGEVEYELLLTQRLVLEPAVELTANSRDDRERGSGGGLSELELGLRLRYEIRRELAPYVGVRWLRSVGDTADLARQEGRDTSELRGLVGIRAWF